MNPEEKFYEEKKQVDLEIDNQLVIISKELDELHTIAKDINISLKVSEKVLEETGEKMEKTDTEIQRTTGRLKKLTKKHPCCCYLLLFVVFVALLGYVISAI